MWKVTIAGALVACSIGAAQAGEPAFDAMDGVSAAPMSDQDMQAVQGKLSPEIEAALTLLFGNDIMDATRQTLTPMTGNAGPVTRVCGQCRGEVTELIHSAGQ